MVDRLAEMKPRISVIMGIYNCASTLREALDSLYAQTYQGFQIIMCDDGSTDNTYAIAEEYAKQKDNIILLRNEKNIKLAATLNRCLEYADTEYVARMDGDDISLPERLEKEIKFLDGHPEYAIVSTPMKYFDECGIFRVGGVIKHEPEPKDFIKGTPFCHAPCMVRKKAYDAVNGYDDSVYLFRVEDYHLWMKMYLNGYRGYCMSDVLYMMRDNQSAMKRRNLKNRWSEFYVKYLICKNFHLSIFNYLYCLKPILLVLVPTFVYKIVHNR